MYRIVGPAIDIWIQDVKKLFTVLLFFYIVIVKTQQNMVMVLVMLDKLSSQKRP